MTGRLELLREIPLFGAFDGAELAAIDALLVEERVAQGETVCTEGDPGDRFFVIVTGELDVWGDNPPRVINRLGTGEAFGEISLLLGGARTATVTAARASTLLSLRKEDFDRNFLSNAKVLEFLTRLLSKRLAAAGRERIAARRSNSVVVTGEAGIPGKSLVAASVAVFIGAALRTETLLIRMSASDRTTKRAPADLEKLASASQEELHRRVRDAGEWLATLDLSVRRQASEDATQSALGGLCERLGSRFRWIVIDVGNGPEPLLRAARQAAHRQIAIVRNVPLEADPSPLHAPLRVLNRHDAATPSIPISHCEPFVLPSDPNLGQGDAIEQARRLAASPRSPASPPLRRLAHKLLGATVGIAAGGGAAFGLAHLGVLRVLEDDGIPIDLLAGTSMGSIVAVGYAAGLTPAAMIEIAERVGTVRTTLSALDLTLLRPGLLAGDRLMAIFRPMIQQEEFNQLVFPLRTVATDIESGECVSICSGRLDLAFRASASVPVIWSPIRHQGRVLVDGAIVNPVPVDVVQQMGADLAIGVNVVPPLKRGVSTALARVFRQVNRWNPLSYLSSERDLPNLFDVTMNTIQQLQHELGLFKAIAADVRITPDLSDFTWIEFYRPKELIERGAEAASRALPEIRRVLAEKRAG